MNPVAIETDPKWRAVLERDASQDGRFFYSVRTTGVYCRPSCASRRANPANVRFHSSAAGAEAAGFRPCKRCRPNEATSERRQAALVAAACRSIDSAEGPVTLVSLAQAAGLSPYYFHRLFRASTGLTPKAYESGKRMEQARNSLAAAPSVADAIYEAGFRTSSRFYDHADGMLGMKPAHFRRGGSQEVIRFAVGECSLGSILVAATETGVCAILLGDEPEPLIRDLERRFPRAMLIGADEGFERVVATVIGFVETPALGLHLPLDVRGTTFQQRVWRALTALPPGTTASYAEIAAAIGVPGAVRAVGSACGANALAVAIPCHRVVRSDGALSSYRWGIARKRTLLQREGTQQAGEGGKTAR